VKLEEVTLPSRIGQASKDMSHIKKCFSPVLETLAEAWDTLLPEVQERGHMSMPDLVDLT
jgi:hypothetical protein